jgi:hypothetical protein
MWAGIAALIFIATASANSIHTVFTTECSPYFTWQSLGMVLSLWLLLLQSQGLKRSFLYMVVLWQQHLDS